MAMTADTADFRPEPRPISTKLDWVQAWRSLQRLLNDKEDTYAVFEIMRALNGDSIAKGYHRLLTTPGGGRLAYERQEFSAKLMDDAWLDSLPAGSVGAAYRQFIRTEQLSAEGLADISRSTAARLTSRIPTPGLRGAPATSTTSGTSCPAITATLWARPVWWGSPMPRPRAWAGR